MATDTTSLHAHASSPLDTISFSAPVTRSEIRAYRAAYKTSKLAYYGVVITLLCVLYALFLGALNGNSHLYIVPMVVVVIGGGISASLRWFENRTVRQNVRFKRFAEQNNFHFHSGVDPQEVGAIFTIGHSRHADGVVSGIHHGKPFWFGTYYYTIGSGKHSRTVITGVLNITLPRAVPYVMLDGKQNRMHIASGIDKSQQLVLEGDFNTYFTVYCPKDYERDVLYFLTPELMQALVDMDDAFDAEIKGTELYFYSRNVIKPTAEGVRNLFTLIENVGGEIVENTQRYQDYRIDKKLGTVAASGLKLKKSVWSVVLGVLILLLYLLDIFS